MGRDKDPGCSATFMLLRSCWKVCYRPGMSAFYRIVFFLCLRFSAELAKVAEAYLAGNQAVDLLQACILAPSDRTKSDEIYIVSDLMDTDLK